LWVTTQYTVCELLLSILFVGYYSVYRLWVTTQYTVCELLLSILFVGYYLDKQYTE
jgi:hypothetical protein